MYFTYSVMENKDICTGCGNCCKKHWLLKLTNKYEKEFFKNKNAKFMRNNASFIIILFRHFISK